jgi:hypothetical protein
VCFGSDYPHPEGLDEPLSWHREISDLAPRDVELIMSSNLSHLIAA